MGQRLLWVLVHEPAGDHEVPGHGLELRLGQAPQLCADLAVQVGGGDILGQRRRGRCRTARGRAGRRRSGGRPLRARTLGFAAPPVPAFAGGRVSATGAPATFGVARVTAAGLALPAGFASPTGLPVTPGPPVPARLPTPARLPAPA